MITDFQKVQIRFRGIIPGILRRGPIAEIELDKDTIKDLVARGVPVYDMNGNEITEGVDMAPPTSPVSPCVVKEVETKKEETPAAPDPIETWKAQKAAEEEAARKQAEVVTAPVTEEETPAQTEENDDEEGAATEGATPVGYVNGVPAMSKNQLKKMKRAAAEAEAKAKSSN